MVQIGYTKMTEQAGPRALVRDVVAAEGAGFDFSVTSDRHFPWSASQGHAPYACSVAHDRIGRAHQRPFIDRVRSSFLPALREL